MWSCNKVFAADVVIKHVFNNIGIMFSIKKFAMRNKPGVFTILKFELKNCMAETSFVLAISQRIDQYKALFLLNKKFVQNFEYKNC